MTQELLVIQGTLPDAGLQSKAAQLAADGRLRLRILSVAKLEHVTADDAVIVKALLPETKNAKIILSPATVRLRSIMPQLAWQLEAGLTADCTCLEITDTGDLIQTRPAFGNSLIATIRTTSPVQMATVRPGTFPLQADARIPEAEAITLPGLQAADGLLQTRAVSTGLAQAKIIVAGGAGIGSKEGFFKLEAFAKRLGGAVGASRNAVDAGYAPYAMQIGITGMTVCPKLYIAVGISGAVQHLSGMSGAGTVIAINSDPKAPIFQHADYGIVGNWESVIEEILEEFT